MPKIDGLAQNCAQTGNAFRPGEDAGQWGIDGEEANVGLRIVTPEAQEQVGLNRLSADITQAGRNDRDSQSRWVVRGDLLAHAAEFLRRFLWRSVT